jgi:non-specific serine/threonine protein kinase
MAAGPEQSTPYVFLSYASADRERALRLADLLEAQGIAVWIDRKSIAGGTSWSAEIVRGIRGCAVLAVACTPAAVSSPNVQQEIQLAWETRRPILPLLLQPIELPDSVRYALAGRQWIEVFDRPDGDWLGSALRALATLGLPARPATALPPETQFPAMAGIVADPLPRHNLPLPSTSFVGRQRETAELRQLLQEPASAARLVTLTGTGGCGKTRLALHVASGLGDYFPDGVWFVDLAPLTDSTLVPQTVAGVLGVREVPGQNLAVALAEYLRARHLLLILDNCEHLIDACARLAQTLLHACQGIRIVATSREILGVAGEVTWRVPSLAVPDPEGRPSLTTIAECDAVQLFLDRARAVTPSFSVTPESGAELLRICRRLDGMPLAIELAAARVRVLTVEQIAVRLADRFRLLTGGSRTALRRQQTLRAAIDWSFDLLSDGERILLRRLSVFAGGWTLEAAEAVCSDEVSGQEQMGERGGFPTPIATADVLDLVTGLVDKSLVLAQGQSGEERYRLLETIRQYAEEKLLDAGEAAIVRTRHRDWYRDFTAKHDAERLGTSWIAWDRRMNAERDNLRAALEWSRSADRSEDAALGLRLVANLSFLWGSNRADLAEGRAWLRAFLELVPEPTALRARALAGACHVARWASDSAEARRLADEELAVSREVGDRKSIGQALFDLGLALASDGDYAAARDRLVESLAIRKEVGDEAGLCMGTLDLGIVTLAAGDLPAARQYLDDSLAIAQRVGVEGEGDVRVMRAQFFLANIDRIEGDLVQSRRRLDRYLGIAVSRSTFARNGWSSLLQAEGDFTSARAGFVDILRQSQEQGDRAQTAQQLFWLGSLAEAQGVPVQAARLLAAAAKVDRLFAPIHYPEVRIGARLCIDRVRSALGDEAFGRTWAEGQAMTLDQAVAYALEGDGG